MSIQRAGHHRIYQQQHANKSKPQPPVTQQAIALPTLQADATPSTALSGFGQSGMMMPLTTPQPFTPSPFFGPDIPQLPTPPSSGPGTPPALDSQATRRQNQIQRIQHLAQKNLPEKGQQFANQLAQTDPSSPEAQQLQARIAALWTGSPQDLQKFQMLNAVQQLNSTANSLKGVMSNLDPSSPEAQQMQARINSLSNERNNINISLRMQKLAQEGLPLQNFQQQLAQQVDPNSPDAQILKSRIDLVNQLIQQGTGDPSSPETQAANARIAALWTGSPQDLQKFQAMGSVRQINSVIGGLNNIVSTLDPSSPQAQQMNARIDALKEQRNTLKNGGTLPATDPPFTNTTPIPLTP